MVSIYMFVYNIIREIKLFVVCRFTTIFFSGGMKFICFVDRLCACGGIWGQNYECLHYCEAIINTNCIIFITGILSKFSEI